MPGVAGVADTKNNLMKHYTIRNLIEGETFGRPLMKLFAVPTKFIGHDTVVSYGGKAIRLSERTPLFYREQEDHYGRGTFRLAYFPFNEGVRTKWIEFTSDVFNSGKTCRIPKSNWSDFIHDVAKRYDKERSGFFMDWKSGDLFVNRSDFI